MPKRWIGRWIIAVSVLHFAAAFALYPAGLTDALGYAGSGSIPPETLASEAYWFFFFAPLLSIVGALVDTLEARQEPIGLAIPIALGLTTAAMLVPMPENGMWLMIIPIIAMLLRARQNPAS
ncbi:MAG: DUF6463 family protein [Pseudomonadota bacterium]